MKRIACLGALAICVAVGLTVWKLHPWMPTGTVVQVGSWTFQNQAFEVWQRKNDDLIEAFATGLFIRSGTDHWHVYCLDFEDVYPPKIVLRQRNSSIVVIQNGNEVGTFDIKTKIFSRGEGGVPVNPVIITNQPPSNWWLSPKKSTANQGRSAKSNIFG